MPAVISSTFSINHKALTANVATLTTTAPHTMVIGDTVFVAGVDATFNGTWIVTAATSTTFSYTLVHANIAGASASGTVTFTLWRRQPYGYVGYLYLDNPPIVFSAQVTGTPTYPIDTISFGSVTFGAYTDIRFASIVLFGSAPGLDDLGRTRVRKPTTPSTIPIGRVSQGTLDGEANITAGSYITILDMFPVTARIPYMADGLTVVNGSTPALGTGFLDWDIAVSDIVNGYPQVNLAHGPHFGDYGDPTSHVLTMSLSPQLYIKTYDAAPSAWLWDVRDGTITAGSSTTAAIAVTFPAGRRVISLQGTDTNGHASVRYLLVAAFQDGVFEPFKVFDTKQQSRPLPSGGATTTFDVTIYSSIPRSTYPDGCPVLYIEHETYGNVTGPINSAQPLDSLYGSQPQVGSEIVKFSGWHWKDDNLNTATREGSLSEVTLKCVDVAAKLDTLPGFPIVMNRRSTPISINDQQNANIDRYFDLYIKNYHSTAGIATDSYNTGTGDIYGFATLGSGQMSLYKQGQELLNRAIGYEWMANNQGMLLARANQNLLLTRTTVSIITLIDADIAEISYTGQRFPRDYWNKGSSVLATTQNVDQVLTPATAFAVAPGAAPGQGPAPKASDYQLTIDSNELYIRTGNRRAEDNNPTGDLTVKLKYLGDAGFDAAYGHWVTLNLTGEWTSLRGQTYVNKRCRIIGVSINRACMSFGNMKDVTLTLRPETVGLVAQPDPQPQDQNPAPPTPPNPVVPSPAPTTLPVGHDGSTVYAANNGRFRITTNWLAAVPTVWASSAWPNGSDDTRSFDIDPYCAYANGGGSLDGWIFAGTGLWWGTGLQPGGTPVWTLKQSFSPGGDVPSFSAGALLHASTNTQGVLYYAYVGVSAGQSAIIYGQLSAYGSTVDWSGAFYDYGFFPPAPAQKDAVFDIDHYGLKSMIFAATFNGSPSNELLQVVNGGAPVVIFRPYGGLGNNNPFRTIQIPLFRRNRTPNNTLSQMLIYAIIEDLTVGGRLFRSETGGASWTELTPILGSYCALLHNATLCFTTNSNVMWCVLVDGVTVVYSMDGGDSWVRSGTAPHAVLSGGFFPSKLKNQFALYLTGVPTDTAMYSPGFGMVILDRSGNMATSGGSHGEVYRAFPLY